MARLVLTHVEPRGSAIAAALREQGHDVVLLAFAQLNPIPGASEALARVDPTRYHRIVIASPSTACFAARARAWPPGCRFAAVGPGTRDALLRAGLAQDREQVELPEGGHHDADALLARSSFATGVGREILVLAGSSGREDWPRTLLARGFAVERIVLYGSSVRVPGEPDWLALQAWAGPQAMRDALAPVFVVTSADAADSLQAGLGERGLATWARQYTVFCPHARIATRLRVHGWRDVHVPGEGQDLLEAALESGSALRTPSGQ